MIFHRIKEWLKIPGLNWMINHCVWLWTFKKNTTVLEKVLCFPLILIYGYGVKASLGTQSLISACEWLKWVVYYKGAIVILSGVWRRAQVYRRCEEMVSVEQREQLLKRLNGHLYREVYNWRKKTPLIILSIYLNKNYGIKRPNTIWLRLKMIKPSKLNVYIKMWL